MVVYIASSKQRSRLCQAISADHIKLKKLIQQYNTVSVAAAEPNILEDDVLSGQFAWSQLTSKACFFIFCIYIWITECNSISTHHKLQIAEAYNNLQRLKEEQELLQTEMMQFISTLRKLYLTKCVAVFKVHKNVAIYTYVNLLHMQVLRMKLVLQTFKVFPIISKLE